MSVFSQNNLLALHLYTLFYNLIRTYYRFCFLQTSVYIHVLQRFIYGLVRMCVYVFVFLYVRVYVCVYVYVFACMCVRGVCVVCVQMVNL